MKFNNRRGEAVTLTIIAFAIISGIVGLWFGQTKYAKVVGLGGPEGQKIVQQSTVKTEPVIFKGPDGKNYVFYKTETKINSSTEEPKMTMWQKLLMLPKIWLLLMILGIFFPPIAGIMAFINKTLAAKAKQIVGGVEDSLKQLDTTPEAKQKVLDTLSKKYDKSTKLYVSKIKSKL